MDDFASSTLVAAVRRSLADDGIGAAGHRPQALGPGLLRHEGALRTFSRALRHQCEDSAPGVRVIDAVLPLVDTDMTRGRGRGEISAARAAGAVISAVQRDEAETYTGVTRHPRTIRRLSPTLDHRVLRHGWTQ
ncbi:hypothetical protein ACU4GG_36150 [Streptomyces nojiriensis]